MFGVKINEFDNSDGTIASFNKIFPKTTLGDSTGEYVEVGAIVENSNVFLGSPFVRNLTFYNQDFDMVGLDKHDFGANNFVNNEDYAIEGSVRFKYYAKALDGTVLAKAYNCEDLAEQLGCHASVVKRRLKSKITELSKTDNKFNITREEL